MTRYAIRFLPTDPYGRAGTTAGNFTTRGHAEAIAREMPNAAHVEVVEK